MTLLRKSSSEKKPSCSHSDFHFLYVYPSIFYFSAAAEDKSIKNRKVTVYKRESEAENLAQPTRKDFLVDISILEPMMAFLSPAWTTNYCLW